MALTEAQQQERAELLEALKSGGYVMARAAETLGVVEATVAARVRRYGLDGLVERHNGRLAARRQNAKLPRAPHEPSRQAQEQARNREQGLCGCGKRTDPFPSGREAKSCKGCRERDRRRKSAGASEFTEKRARNVAAGRCACGGAFAPLAGSDRRACVGCGALSPSRPEASRAS